MNLDHFALLNMTPQPTMGWVLLIAGFVVFVFGFAALMRTRQSRWFLLIYGAFALLFASLVVHDGGVL